MTDRRLHHVALGAADVELVASFYRELLGLSEERRQLDAEGALFSVWLVARGTRLMIERSAEPPRRVDGIGRGPFLLAWSVSAEERAALELALDAAGVAIESRTQFSSYFRDPEGNRVAISHYPDP